MILNDQLVEIAEEATRAGSLDKLFVGLDYFDASINRIGAWVIGARATLKSFLYALLQPVKVLIEYEENGKYFHILNNLMMNKICH